MSCLTKFENKTTSKVRLESSRRRKIKHFQCSCPLVQFLYSTALVQSSLFFYDKILSSSFIQITILGNIGILLNIGILRLVYLRNDFADMELLTKFANLVHRRFRNAFWLPRLIAQIVRIIFSLYSISNIISKSWYIHLRKLWLWHQYHWYPSTLKKICNSI